MWRARFFPIKYKNWPGFSSDKKCYINNTASCYQQVKLATKSSESEFREGQELEGFTVQQITNIPEFQLKAIRLQHDDTRAQYLHLQREDTNNAFSIHLRTTPFDSSGVPHILEHTTLCGSKKYPCRDPFFKMLNRSLATFINAQTWPDFTLYPFATQNQKDYYNLMSVYMDAVFNPQLKESDFRQEGWRLEHENVDDPNSPIIFKGVVFNEMKGALSENQRIFGESLMNKILPSHTYSVISGGDPLHIPQLTYDQLKAFHAQYYHPSNARFYSYGNFSLINHLKFINDNYLRNYGKVKEDFSEFTKVPLEKRWTSEKRDHVYGKVDNMASDPNKQSTLAVGYLCSDIKDVNETCVLQVLSELLTSGPNSAFYKSLVEPNVGSSFSSVTGFEGHTRDTFFSVGLQGLNPKDFDWVTDTCNKTIDKVIEEGFDQSRIDAIIHNIELNTKHQASDFGMRFLFSLSSLWNHNGDLLKALRVNDLVANLKTNMSNNPRYLQQKVEQYFKVNNHKLILTMTPDEQYDEKKMKQENELLQLKLSSLTTEMKNKLYEDGIKLREEQDKKQNVDCLPTLKSSDLKEDIERSGLRYSKHGGVPVQFCAQPTNNLTYLKGILDTSFISKDIKPYIPLFTTVATKMGTKYHNYRDFDQLAQLKTGGLSLSLHLSENKNDSNGYENGILFSSYALDSNIETMFSLWGEIFNNVTFEDKSRLETLMKSSADQMVSNLADQGHLYAMGASAALVNPAALRNEENSGLRYVTWLCSMVQQNKYDEVLSKLDSVAKNVFSKKYMRLAVNYSHESKQKVESAVESFVNSLQGSFENTFISVHDNEMADKNHKLGVQFEIPLPVNYTSKSIPTVPYTHADFAPLRILCRLLSSKYLLPMVREKGGAYGAGARLTPSGVISYFSYRDPNPAQTFNTFDDSLSWINKGDFTEQDVEESKLGTFQAIDAPIPPGAQGSRDFIYGITEEEFKDHRLKLMSVTKEDIVKVASIYLDPNRDVCEGRVLLGPLNEEVSKRPREKWITERL
ncbi:presequence protease, mitochondrial [Homalodisca vitripennis]|uniref:presequence protease, mitochondrial n=1 Tax=Homalodisca vitripennis TaxID=197043 RepID=UPI001EEB1295|nr:presequence protease, mitochondrial [Homalodisca vitripennis]